MNDLPAASVLSLMSGTSLDGVDGVLARFELQDGTLVWEVLDRAGSPYPDDLRARLEAALRPETSDVLLLTQLHTEVGHAYAQLAEAVALRHSVDLIALSGQTVYHIPRVDESRGWRTVSTLQLGEASITAERCRLPVLSDFRQGDMAAGGQAAPMVSFGDLKLFSAPGRARAVHNLGGISNLTYLPSDGGTGEVFAFDTGPSTCLINEAMMRHYRRPFDEGGRTAAAGRVVLELLAQFLDDDYYDLPPPKTTGREHFSLAELERRADLDAVSPADLIATLTALTAESVTRAYRRYVLPFGLDEIFVAGGGALNPTLMRMLRERLPVPVMTFEERSWHSRDREALAFGVMAYYAYHGLANTLPSATGAAHPAVAGKLSLPWRG
ncbi:MAG: anhydro-N-acetylmuramic acid kinase [Truepera sp.]|nr:anhydro-N-acetylmuramic acid kinase [Truepera sp.]